MKRWLIMDLYNIREFIPCTTRVKDKNLNQGREECWRINKKKKSV